MKLKKHLKWIEAGMYLGGAALVITFLLIRGESQRQAQAGIDAFNAAVENRQSATPETQDSPVDATDEWAATPDQGDWAEQRIIDYEKSLAEYTETPHAILRIESLGIEVPVFNGTEEPQLNRGVGRILGTAQVDEVGNLGIAGHRDGFFRPLKDIEVGDEIRLLTHQGEEKYTVSSIVITDPNDVSVLKPTDEKTITLVTCYPFYYVGHAPERFIVKARVEHLFATTKRGSI